MQKKKKGFKNETEDYCCATEKLGKAITQRDI